MKDSQRRLGRVRRRIKYIKVNNERFSTDGATEVEEF